jgi:hypothetical protein
MSTRSRKRRVEHIDNWERLLSLFEQPEQERYEAIRPLVFFGDSMTERAEKPASRS